MGSSTVVGRAVGVRTVGGQDRNHASVMLVGSESWGKASVTCSGKGRTFGWSYNETVTSPEMCLGQVTH